MPHATTPSDWGNFLREARQRAGRSQAEVAATAGVSRRWLISFENGASTEQLNLVLRVAQVLRVVPMLDVAPPTTIWDDLDVGGTL